MWGGGIEGGCEFWGEIWSLLGFSLYSGSSWSLVSDVVRVCKRGVVD